MVLTWSIFQKLRSDPGYRQWADVASQLFGGLDILTVDAIIEAETGKVGLGTQKQILWTVGIRAWSGFPLELIVLFTSPIPSFDMAVCQNLVPLVNIKIAGKWMFIPLKMVLIGIDPFPYLKRGKRQLGFTWILSRATL